LLAPKHVRIYMVTFLVFIRARQNNIRQTEDRKIYFPSMLKYDEHPICQI